MHKLRREPRSSRVVRHIHGQKHRLIAWIRQPRGVEGFQAAHKHLVAAQQLDQLAHIVRYKKHVLPDAALKRFRGVACQTAPTGERAACYRILVAPSSIKIFGLE